MRAGETDPARHPAQLATLLLIAVVGMRVFAKTASEPDQLLTIRAAPTLSCWFAVIR